MSEEKNDIPELDDSENIKTSEAGIWDKWAKWVDENPWTATFIAFFGLIAFAIPTGFVIAAAGYNFFMSEDNNVPSDNSGFETDDDEGWNPQKSMPYSDTSETNVTVVKEQPEIIKKFSALYDDFSEQVFAKKQGLSFEATINNEDTVLTISSHYWQGPFDEPQSKEQESYNKLNAFKQFLEVTFNYVVDAIQAKSAYLSSQYTKMGHYFFQLKLDPQRDIFVKDANEQAIKDFSRAWQVRSLLYQEINGWCGKNYNKENTKLSHLIEFIKNALQGLNVVKEEDDLNSRLFLAGGHWYIQAGANNDISAQIKFIENLNNYLCNKFQVDNSKLKITLSQETRPKNCLVTIKFNVLPDAFDNILNISASEGSEIETKNASNYSLNARINK